MKLLIGSALWRYYTSNCHVKHLSWPCNRDFHSGSATGHWGQWPL